MKSKKNIVTILFIASAYFAAIPVNAQQNGQVNAAQSLVLKLARQSLKYSTGNFDSAKYFGQRAIALADSINFISGKIIARCYLGVAYTRSGDIPKALPLQFEALQIAKDNRLFNEESLSLYANGKSYFFLKDSTSALRLFREAYNRFKNFRDDNEINSYREAFFDTELSLGRLLIFSGKTDSAIYYLKLVQQEGKGTFAHGVSKLFLGQAYFLNGQKQLGISYLKEAAEEKLQSRDYYTLAWSCGTLANCYKEINQPDSAIYYAKIGLSAAQQIGFKDRLLQINQLLAEMYESIDLRESHNYLKKAVALNEELFGSEKIFQLQKAVAEQQQKIQEAEKKRIAYESNIRQYALIAGIGIFLIIALLLYRNNRQKQKANNTLKKTLADLKSTQTQLIQSEKMASLGELTAGIAHEIQNPLNFVNNFSEVNKELVDEMQAELKAGKIDDAIAISNDIKENEEKINHHGKRADAIVKGMLQHSNSGSGKKESTDINKLADEYLRLAYHGLRAKDKSFNATLKTEYDESIGNINIIPQDIGRVILNLITNAFYVVDEKKKSGVENYEPTVSVSTKKINDTIEIKVSDNGNGIPKKILDKIFQPFFTTKPTGQGTGLGLSLSYDIVKAHGGEIKVETKEGEGTEFIIYLPSTNA
jgi:signal transduction histidine kinase